MNGEEQNQALEAIRIDTRAILTELNQITKDARSIRVSQIQNTTVLETILDEQTTIIEKLENILTESAEAQEEPSVKAPAAMDRQPESVGSGIDEPVVEEPATTSQQPESDGRGVAKDVQG